MKKEYKDKLEKRAFGYTVSETTKEYAMENGKLTLVKQKVNKKHIPLDVSACKMLDTQPPEESIESLTDEELEAQKRRLLEELKEISDNAD